MFFLALFRCRAHQALVAEFFVLSSSGAPTVLTVYPNVELVNLMTLQHATEVMHNPTKSGQLMNFKWEGLITALL